VDSVSTLHDSLELLLLLQEGRKLVQIQLGLLVGLGGGLKALDEDIEVSAMGVADELRFDRDWVALVVLLIVNLSAKDWFHQYFLSFVYLTPPTLFRPLRPNGPP
jgi:hypothetical protein